jgi:hypothetical protein
MTRWFLARATPGKSTATTVGVMWIVMSTLRKICWRCISSTLEMGDVPITCVVQTSMQFKCRPFVFVVQVAVWLLTLCCLVFPNIVTFYGVTVWRVRFVGDVGKWCLCGYHFGEGPVLELHNLVELPCEVSDLVGQFHTPFQIWCPQETLPFGTPGAVNQLLSVPVATQLWMSLRRGCPHQGPQRMPPKKKASASKPRKASIEAPAPPAEPSKRRSSVASQGSMRPRLSKEHMAVRWESLPFAGRPSMVTSPLWVVSQEVWRRIKRRIKEYAHRVTSERMRQMLKVMGVCVSVVKGLQRPLVCCSTHGST